VNESDQGRRVAGPATKESIMFDKSEFLTRGHNGQTYQVPLHTMRVPDIWKAVTSLEKSILAEEGLEDAQREWMVEQTKNMLECWHLCHDLLRHARDVQTGFKRN
jgi:hypothetical protein